MGILDRIFGSPGGTEESSAAPATLGMRGREVDINPAQPRVVR